MKTGNINSNITESYLGLLKTLTPEEKLEIIEQLTNTLKVDFSDKQQKTKNSFGSWVSDKSAEQIIDEIKSSRDFNRKLETLL